MICNCTLPPSACVNCSNNDTLSSSEIIFEFGRVRITQEEFEKRMLIFDNQKPIEEVDWDISK